MGKSAGKVFSYTRFSDIRQAAGASVERQGDYAARWAREHDLTLDDTLSMRDEGLSAYHQKHVTQGALGTFLKAIDDGRVPAGSVLIVEGLDRLSRAEPIQAQAQLAQIINGGVTVVTASDGKAYSRPSLKANPMDLVYSLLVMIRAHEESDTKSKRTRDAQRRMTLAWAQGTSRKAFRSGRSPSWLRFVDGTWQLVPERVHAIRTAIDLYRGGAGTVLIAQTLKGLGLSVGDGESKTARVLQVLQSPALIGERHAEVDGETMVLDGFYPPIITRPEWDELQSLLSARARKFVRGDIPSILTGFGGTRCGYCGATLKAQTLVSRRDANGLLSDGMRRLRCSSGDNLGAGTCPVPGSCSAAPIERAIIEYCSDMMNLQSLYGGDRSAAPRRELAAVQAKLRDTETRLARVLEALEGGGGTLGTLTARMRELEGLRSDLLAQEKVAEAALAATARSNLEDADSRWASVAQGVQALDYGARMQARQLMADTFESIQVYHLGAQRGPAWTGRIDLVLKAKGGGITKRLNVDVETGKYTLDDTITATPPPPTKKKAPTARAKRETAAA